MVPAASVGEEQGAPSSGRLVAAASWLGALLTAVALLALTGYTSRDPDSNVYAGISARLSTEPVARWIAPEWWGHWGFEGPFREHPVGILVAPAALARLGYPAGQAAYAVNTGFQVLSLVLIGAVAARVVAAREARALRWMLQLVLIAFVFRIRANQEYAVLAGVLTAIYATERSRANASWAWVTGAAFAWVLLVKGIFGLMVPALCAVWLLVRRARGDASAVQSMLGGASWRPAPWLALGATLLVLPALTLAYESMYARVTGESFLAFYAGPRLDADAVAENALLRWPVNAAWYSGRLIWYALPWSPFTLVAIWVWWPRRGAGESSGGLAFSVLASACLVAAFAAADRRADRFIFPAYFFFAAAGAVASLRWLPRFARLADRLDRPWVAPALFLALFLARLASGPYLPRLMLR